MVLIYVLVLIKCVVVQVNMDLGLFFVEWVRVIMCVVDEVLNGEYVSEFLFLIW